MSPPSSKDTLYYEKEGFAPAPDGTRLFYGLRGSGPTLVLSDGIGCDGFAWRYLQPVLAKRYRVLHWHYRGHGRSGAPVDRKQIDVPTLVRDLVCVLDATDTERAVLVGHSLGTQIGLEFYREMPARTLALILMCGSYGHVTQTFHGTDLLQQVLPSLIEMVQKHYKVARALWGQVPTKLAYRVARLSNEVDAASMREEDFRHYWEHIAVMDPDLYLNMLRAVGEHSAEDLLPNIDVPTLVIAAERDTFTPPQLAEHMARSIPGARHVLVKNGSHAAPVEQPEVFQRAIERFLDSHLEGAGSETV